MKQINLIIMMLLAPSLSFAFINIEAIRNIPGEGFVGSSGAQFNGQEGNTNKLSSQATTLGVYRLQRDEILFVGDYHYGTSSGVKDTNRGHGHIRYTFLHQEKLAYEVFAQSEFDEFKDLNSRNLLGANIRNRILANEAHLLFLGYGSFYEVENFSGAERHEGFRGNFYLSYSYKLNETVSSGVTIYYQPLFKDFETHRLRVQSGIDIRINETLNFDIDLNVTHDNALPEDVKPTDIDYMAGFTVTY